MYDEQDEKNQSDSFLKQQTQKGKEIAKDEAKKQVKQKVVRFLVANPEVLAVIAIVILVAILLIVFFCGSLYVVDKWKENDVNDSKNKAMQVSYSGDNPTTETDENGNIINKIVVQPNKKKDGYEISYNDDSDNLENIKKKLEAQTSRSASEFTDFELAVLGALMDNGANLDYYTAEQLHCFPAFIKAEACTQYLDLRSNSEKNTTTSSDDYKPAELSDNRNDNVVPGTILVQRVSTKDYSNPTVLEYISYDKLEKMQEKNDKEALKYFSINNSGDLVYAIWSTNNVKVTYLNDKDKLPEDIKNEINGRSTGGKDEYSIELSTFDYSGYVSNYTIPFEFLVQLLVVTEEPSFCMELVEDYIIKSKIVLCIHDEQTYTEINETKTYTVHDKYTKKVDYRVNEQINGQEIENETNSPLIYGKDDNATKQGEDNNCTYYETSTPKVNIITKQTTTTPKFTISELDTWIYKYKENYETDEDVTPTITEDKYEVLGDSYQETDNKDIKTTDEHVNKFIEEKNVAYKSVIESVIPRLILNNTTESSTGKEIKFITIDPADKIANISPYCINTIYYDDLDDKGKELGTYSTLPRNISVTTKAISATDTTKTVPQIRFNYELKGISSYGLTNGKEPIVAINVSKAIEIKEQKVDEKSESTTSTTTYPKDETASQNPYKHVYATANNKPGKGHGDKNTTYEKFLVAYDNNKNARDQINSINYWLFEMMQNNDKTKGLERIIRYLLYAYDGTSYGVSELGDDFFENYDPAEINTFDTSIYGDSIQEKVWFALKDLGYSDVSIAAAMGNIHYESETFDPTKIEGGYNENNGGIGICQWTNNNRGSTGRNTNLKNYAKSKGKTWQDEDTQVEFLIGELTKGGGANGYATYQLMNPRYTQKKYNYKDWVEAKDSEKLDKNQLNELTEVFCFCFERPNESDGNKSMKDRQKYALQYYNQFHGKERAGGTYTKGKGDVIATFTSGITGKTYTIFNQTSGGLSTSKGKAWGGYCNKCVAACIATGYNGGNANNALDRALKWDSILSNSTNTNKYFSEYGLTAKISGGSAYSKSKMKSALTSGKHIALWFNGEANGKSGQNYCHSIHWIGVIGYKNEGGKEQIFISDSAHGGTGWKDLDEFENCKNKIVYYTVISEK